MEQEYGVVVAITQDVPEGPEAEQVTWIFEQLLWVVKEGFIEHNDVVDDLPTIEEASRGGGDKQVEARLRVGFAQGTQGGGGEQEIADCCQVYGKDMRIR